MAGKGKGKRLTDCERMQIIAKLEDPMSSVSRAACAKDYGVSPAAISKLMKVSHSVKKRYSDAGDGGQRDKRQRGGFSKNVRFEDELYQWICSVRARKVPLLVSNVQQKAKLLAAQHGMNGDFKASNGWYYRFCGRYGLHPAMMHAGTSSGVGATAPEATQETKVKLEERRLNEIRDKVREFGEEFVYTVSEARLFYQLLPSQIRPGEVNVAGDASGLERNGGSKTARVLVLVCTNGTGSHKVPLLVIGKEEAPACLSGLQSVGGIPVAGAGDGVGMGTTYYSQREVWCDDRTFQHWCQRVFLPAVRQRTARPVLLIAENPGGRITPFEEENASTIFLPFRTAGGVGEVITSHQNDQPANAGMSTSGVGSYVQLQPLHGAVIHDLKRRYKIGLFQERLGFLEKTDEERFRLMQLAMKKPVGRAGVAFGRLPHLLDTMRLLDEAWAAIPAALISSSWIRSNLGDTTPALVPILVEPTDANVVTELCFLVRNVALVEDTGNLGKDLLHWLNADDDSSERMQQELLYDIQQLLQEEEQNGSGKESVSEQPQQQEQPFDPQQERTAVAETTGMPTSFDLSQAGNYVYDTDGRQAPMPPVDPNTVLREKRKAVNFALQALSGAEEMLDNRDVAEFFGEDVTIQAVESVSRALRRLRRIQRGKRSTLVATALSAATNGDGVGSESARSALATHEYFYGDGGHDNSRVI